MIILVIGRSIIAIAPEDAGEEWRTDDLIIPKSVVSDAELIDAVLPDDFSIFDYEWDGSEVVKKIDPQPIDIPPCPDEISMGQAKEALLRMGLLDTVNQVLAGLPGEEGEIARIQWEYRSVVRRDWPMIEQVRLVMGWSIEQVDAVFVMGATL